MRLRIEFAAVVLEDLGTPNGTLLNGKKIQAAVPLASGDEFQIGETKLRFAAGEESGPPDRREPEPEPETLPEAPKVTAKRGREPEAKPEPRAPKEEPKDLVREARLEKYVRKIEAEDKDQARRATVWREDLAQRTGVYQLLIALALIGGGIALFAVAYLVAMLFVGEG